MFQPDKKGVRISHVLTWNFFPWLRLLFSLFEALRANTRAFHRSTLPVTKRTGFDHVVIQEECYFCCTWLVQGWSCWGDYGVGSWLLWGPSTPQSEMWWGKGQSLLQRGCWRQLHDKSNKMTNTSVLEINTHFSFLLESSQSTWYQSASMSYPIYYYMIILT